MSLLTAIIMATGGGRQSSGGNGNTWPKAMPDTLFFQESQSNGFGKASFTDTQNPPINTDTFPFGAVMDRVWICSGASGTLQKLQVPVNNDGVPVTGGGFGPELGKGQRWMEETTSGNLIIFKTYLDGHPIADFQKSNNPTYYNAMLSRYQAMVADFAANGLNPTQYLADLIQGEGDFSQTQSYYYSNLQAWESDRVADGMFPSDITYVMTQIQSGTPGYGAGVVAAKTQFVNANPGSFEVQYPTPVGPDYYIENGSETDLHMNAAGQLQFAYNIMEQTLGFPAKQVNI